MGTIICRPDGSHPRLLLRSQRASVDRFVVLRFLRDMKRHMRGRKLLLFWDGLPAHRALIVRDWINANRAWLRIERMPAYAPELNPPEYLWSATKKCSGNIDPFIAAVRTQVRKARHRYSNAVYLRGFLRASGLFG